MVVREQKIFEFFAQAAVPFSVPLFQRRYEWDRPQWERVWGNIEKILQPNAANHFFGSVVCLRQKRRTAFPRLILIDGQRRLTTLSIFFCLLRNLAMQRSQYDVAKTINNRYLANPHENGERSLRLLLSASSGDHGHYLRMVEQAGHYPIPDKGKSSRLHLAYRFFEKKMIRISDTDVGLIWEKLVSKFFIDGIVLDPKDNPYRVLADLEPREKPLFSADLIRHFIFMRLSGTPKKQQHIYRTYWQPMENRLGEQHLTEFMRHFLIMQKEAGVRETDVYDEMCGCAKRADRHIHDFLATLHRLARQYAKIIYAEDELRGGIRCHFARLNLLNYTNTHSFLLQLYGHYESGGISENDLIRSLLVLESFLIRRLICGVPTAALNVIFPKLFHEILRRQTQSPCGDFPHTMQRLLIAEKYPDDAAFAAAFARYRFYHTSGNNERCRFILDMLESAVSGKALVVPAYTNISIEHIMPQKLSESWKADLGGHWEFIHKKYLHTIGNLTLTGLNTMLSNIPYAEKRHILRSSHFCLNRYFAKAEQWSETAILDRADMLAKLAVEIWAYFGPAASTSPPSKK